MSFCDTQLIELTPACMIKNGVETAAAVVDFAKDPIGAIAKKLQESAAGLAGTVLPELQRLTLPDLSMGWFADAYKVSFALAMFIFVIFLGWNFVQLARRQVSGDEVVETLTFYIPLFFGGVIFGPLLGTMILSLTGALTKSLTDWGVVDSVDQTTAALNTAIVAGDPAKMAGGSIVAIGLFFCMVVSLILAFCILLVMLVTLYLTGAIIPLSLVWLVQPRQRAKGTKVLMVWLGICASHVLLFFLLGIAFHMVGGLTLRFQDSTLTTLANLVVAVIALLMATLSPYALLKFAPVGPSAGGSGPALSAPSYSRSGGGSGYAESSSDSQTAQMARDTRGGGAESGGESDAGGASGSGGGGLMARLAAKKSQDSAQSSSSMEPAGGGSGGSGGSAQGSSEEIAEQGTEARDGARGMASAGGKAQGVGSALGAVGTAADVTVVGAPVGLALQAAGAAVLAGGAALSTTAELAQSAGDMAVDHMDHAEIDEK
ncbi:MAG: hypothetical protein ABI661_04620 [Gammaproteobacteria bacterium]